MKREKKERNCFLERKSCLLVNRWTKKPTNPRWGDPAVFFLHLAGSFVPPLVASFFSRSRSRRSSSTRPSAVDANPSQACRRASVVKPRAVVAWLPRILVEPVVTRLLHVLTLQSLPPQPTLQSSRVNF